MLKQNIRRTALKIENKSLSLSAAIALHYQFFTGISIGKIEFKCKIKIWKLLVFQNKLSVLVKWWKQNLNVRNFGHTVISDISKKNQKLKTSVQ